MTQHIPVPTLISMGDPAGCGPFLCDTLWGSLQNTSETRNMAAVGCKFAFDAHGILTTPHTLGETIETNGALPLIQTEPCAEPVIIGQPTSANAASVISAIEFAAKACLSGKAAALVTAPIAKSVLYEAGFAFPGHTELLADLSELSETQKPIMMLVGGGLRVALATIHLPLKNVSEALSVESLCTTARIVNHDLQNKFALPAPRIAFSGLNPHAGENGTIGREEIDVINPAAALLRQDGINISDARPADTVFHEALSGQFDAVIAMTHDQGLIPVKTLDIWGGVNVTLGLPIIRTSPDHGTAFEATRGGTLNPRSMRAAFDLAQAQIVAQNA